METSSTHPLVSVCITAYNHEAYIRQAIQSAVFQHCDFEYEVVVGVDLSSDRTLEIAREMESAYPDKVRVESRDPKVGMRRNYRLTIEQCRGKYIAFLDGDDYFIDPTKLQKQADEMLKFKDMALCYTFSQRIDESGARERHPKDLKPNFIERNIGTYRIENCTTMALKERIMEYYAEVRPEEHPEWLTEDLPMWLYITGKYMTYFIPDETAVHRIVTGSVSHCRSYHDTIVFCDSMMNIILYYDHRFNNDGIRRRLIRKRENDVLWLLSHKGTNREFIDRWKKAISACPVLVLDPVPYVFFLKKVLYRNRKRG